VNGCLVFKTGELTKFVQMVRRPPLIDVLRCLGSSHPRICGNVLKHTEKTAIVRRGITLSNRQLLLKQQQSKSAVNYRINWSRRILDGAHLLSWLTRNAEASCQRQRELCHDFRRRETGRRHGVHPLNTN